MGFVVDGGRRRHLQKENRYLYISEKQHQIIVYTLNNKQEEPLPKFLVPAEAHEATGLFRADKQPIRLKELNLYP
jgi:hypothetical protein